MLTRRENEILDLIEQNPLITQDELAKRLGISRSGIASHIHNLTNKGFIKGRGYLLSEPKFVTVVGGINMDIIGQPDTSFIKNDSNQGDIFYYLGGAGRNIALNLTKLEIPNYLISAYGNDLYGERFEEESFINDMNIKCCEKLDDFQTSSYMSIYTNKEYYAIDDMKIDDYLTPMFVKKYIDRINTSQYCIIDANLPADTISYLYENVTVPIIAKTVSIDKNNHLITQNKNFELKLLITNTREMEHMLAEENIEVKNLNEAIKILLDSGVENIILNDVYQKLHFFNKKEEHYYKYDIDNKNNRGSNASICAGTIWGLLNNYSWKYILKLCYTMSLLTSEVNDSVHPNLNIDFLFDAYEEIFE